MIDILAALGIKDSTLLSFMCRRHMSLLSSSLSRGEHQHLHGPVLGRCWLCLWGGSFCALSLVPGVRQKADRQGATAWHLGTLGGSKGQRRFRHSLDSSKTRKKELYQKARKKIGAHTLRCPHQVRKSAIQSDELAHPGVVRLHTNPRR